MSGAPSQTNNIEAVFPLSPTQEGMLYHTLKSPESAVYVGQHVLEIEKADSKLLREAWRLVVAQHMALRTVFAWKALSRPVQVVYRAYEPDWRELDVPTSDGAAELLAADAAERFSLDKLPPSRVTWLKLSQERGLLVWTRHHVLMDGWSAQLVIGEFHRAYTALAQGQPWRPRPDPGMAAYVAWLQKQDAVPSVEHWRKALANAPRNPGLEAVRSSALGGRSTRRISARLAAEHRDALTKCAAANQLTLSTLIHGAWAAVLASLNVDSRVIFGSTVSGRPADLLGQDRIVGNLINTVPIVADTSDQDSLAVWLRRLQAAIVTAARHGHLPNRELLTAAGIEPGTTLFDSIVVFMNYPRVGELETALRVTRSSYDEHSHYPLAVLALPGDELELILIHDEKIIAAERADALLKLLEARLISMPAATAQPAAQYFRAERTGPALARVPLRVEPRTVTAHYRHAIRAHASRPALCHDDAELTYSELHARVTQLAARMDTLGVRPGDRVVIQMRRSVDAVATVWAALLLGATYVPVSSETPLERLRGIAERVKARLVVGDHTLDVGKELLLPRDVARDHVTFELDPNVPLHDAYVIFTSGSTGTPKAITVTHEQLAHSLASRLQYYGSEPVRFGLFSPLAFDSSVAGLFWTVASGGCLVVVDEDLVMRPRYTVDYLLRHRVDTYLTLPSVHRALLDSAQPALAERLKTVIVAGEPCPAAILVQHRSTLPRVCLVNEYGPTEATVWCAARRFDADDHQASDEAYLSIGHAIPGVGLSIQDEAGRSVSTGVTGELVVSGLIVAAPNRAGGNYATGDLVSANAAGEIFFRGRKDQQLKVRGHRVDPLEIEAAVMDVPGITEAAVIMARPEGASHEAAGVLTAFFAGQSHITEATLSAALASRLPNYMMPGRFVRLDVLPRSGNGKLARDRLSLPAAAPPGAGAERAAGPELSLYPRQAGIMIGNVWRELIPGVAIDLDSNFFEIGGDSLLALRMLARVERMFATSIDLTVFITRPILGDFAEAVVRGLPAAEPSDLITLRVGSGSDRSRSVFCVHGDGFNLVPVLDPTLTLHWISQWRTRIGLTKHGRLLPLESVDTIAARYQRYVEQVGAVCPVLIGSCAALPVTLELGKRLSAAGNPPRALILMDFPGRALAAPLSGRLRHRITHSPLKSAVGYARYRLPRLIRDKRASRTIMAKVRASQPLTEVEARFYTQTVLAEAVKDYAPGRYEGKVVVVLSQRWRRGVADESSARLPDPWASAFSQVTIKFSPAADHNDLLARESAALVARLIAAEWR